MSKIVKAVCKVTTAILAKSPPVYFCKTSSWKPPPSSLLSLFISSSWWTDLARLRKTWDFTDWNSSADFSRIQCSNLRTGDWWRLCCSWLVELSWYLETPHSGISAFPQNWPTSPNESQVGSSWLPRVIMRQSGSSMKNAKSRRKISQAFGPGSKRTKCCRPGGVGMYDVSRPTFFILFSGWLLTLAGSGCEIFQHIGFYVFSLLILLSPPDGRPRSAISPLKIYLPSFAHVSSFREKPWRPKWKCWCTW